MKAFALFVAVVAFALAGCVAMPTRVVYVPVPYIPVQNGTVQQAYVPPVYPVYQTPMYPMYPRNIGYCPGPWCPQQQFGGGYGGYGRGGSFFYYRRHGHGGRW